MHPWDQRYQIAQDIARGLFLIHSSRVLLRDMKSLHIQFDKDMRAKISGFNLSTYGIKTKKMNQLFVPRTMF